MKLNIVPVAILLAGSVSVTANPFAVAESYNVGLSQTEDSNVVERTNAQSATHEFERIVARNAATFGKIDVFCEIMKKFGCECSCKPTTSTTSSVPPTSTSTTSSVPPTSTSTTSSVPPTSTSTTSSTMGSTSTTTSSACATPTCGTHGLKYTRYDNPFKMDFTSDYKSFNLSYFESQKPLDAGVTNTIYLKTDAGNETFSHAALEYRTFLYACRSGNYKFTSPSTDDATLMWFGEDHVKDSTRENADIAQFWYGDNSAKTVEKYIKADTYYPIRILWGNTNGAGFLNLEVYGPDGQQLTGSSTAKTESYLVTQACDASYNPYGGGPSSNIFGGSGEGGSGKGQGTFPSI